MNERRRISDFRGIDTRRGVPDWEVEEEFGADVFTFVRIRFTSWRESFNRRGRGRGGRSAWGRSYIGHFGWDTDYPDSDLNFSFRLQQLTSMEVDPDGLVLDLTDPRLFDYPFIYLLEPGDLVFSEDEVVALRKYLLNGGFLMVDDFWGEAEWANFYKEIKRVFPEPEFEPEELDISHEIFQAVFVLKEKPQICSINEALSGRSTGRTWEREDAREVHFKAMYDDKERMMMIICHNTDLGDGWEREGENEWYFHEFSEKKAYPMGINIVFYAMTH
ncbi:MAG: transmembrane prediction [Phycisphaerae bacterium SM23_30]|nr:MAG: transmembrane prediction [Phycisphaerae bacterium SM23_30]